MTIWITGVHMEGGNHHEHIAEVKWLNDMGKSGQSQRAQIVTWLQQGGNFAKVARGQGSVPVGVVEARVPYLRTYADNTWTDNLLALPKY